MSEHRATDQQPRPDAVDVTGAGGDNVGSIDAADAPNAARDRGVTRRRTAAVGILAVLLFAVAFAVGTATKGHRSVNGGAQPAQAAIGSHSAPAKITAVLESSSVPGLRQVKVKKPAPAPPSIVASGAPGPTTTFAPAPAPAPAPPQAPGPSHTIGGGSLGGGGGSTGGGLGGGGSSTGGGG